MAINIFSSRRLDGYRIMIPFVDNRSLDVINVSGAHDHKPTSYAANPPTLSIKMTVLAHAARDFAGQVAGRTIGLGIFNAAAYAASSSVPCRVIAGGLGAVFGGLQAQHLAAQVMERLEQRQHREGRAAPRNCHPVMLFASICASNLAVTGAAGRTPQQGGRREETQAC